jgi:SAM-dependent methyltransferase
VADATLESVVEATHFDLENRATSNSARMYSSPTFLSAHQARVMSYAEETTQDRNRIKRWLQRQRFVSASALYSPAQSPSVICDFGAGNGEMCKVLAPRFPRARLICYEPSPTLLQEAKANLNAASNVVFMSRLDVVPETVDAVFCLEVFEHLPHQQTLGAFARIKDILKPQGVLIVGLPVEIGIPAIYRGLFRMVRRYGAFDATIEHVLLAAAGFPPANRPIVERIPGFPFFDSHMGFDHRVFRNALANHFEIVQEATSPFVFGSWLMPEVNFMARHR